MPQKRGADADKDDLVEDADGEDEDTALLDDDSGEEEELEELKFEEDTEEAFGY